MRVPRCLKPFETTFTVAGSPTPKGDFTSDVKRDKNFPDASTWAEVESYLQQQWQTCDESIEAARSVWRQYEARHR
jgi:hypothetical protein